MSNKFKKTKLELEKLEIMNNLKLNKKWPYFKCIKNEDSQSSVIEYSVFVVCLILALISIQGYLKRSMLGALRTSADTIGSQYDPTTTSMNFTISSRSDIFTNVVVEEQGGNLTSTTTVTTNLDETTRQGTEIVGAYN